MLPDIGATELMVIAAVALVVVGPKDLPLMLKKLGQLMGKMRRMATEFRSSFDDMARQSELEDLRREVEAMRTQAVTATSTDSLGLQQTMNEIHASMDAAPADLGGEVSTPWQEPPETPKEKIAREAAEAAAKKARPRAKAKPAVAKAATAKAPAAKAKTQIVEGGPKPKAATTKNPAAQIVEAPAAPKAPARRKKASA